jgi:hypothetical protein
MPNTAAALAECAQAATYFVTLSLVGDFGLGDAHALGGLLLSQATAGGQQRDIDKAKELLAEYKARKKAMAAKSSSKHKG